MIPESSKPEGTERYLSIAAVAGRFLVTLDNVRQWIADGKLKTVRSPRGSTLVTESSLLDFQAQAYRREAFNGIDHGLHSWRTEEPQSSMLPVPAMGAGEAEALAPRWPFPHA